MDQPPTPKRLDSFSERTCWVCFATEEDEPGSDWTCPCMCRGATKWVHQVCLQQWIDEKQKGSSSIDVSCPQCQYPYQILYPSASPFLVCYEYLNRAITFSAPMILAGLTASSIYWVSFTYGIAVATVSLGRERSIAFFGNPESSILVLTLPLLPWVALSVKLVRLEVQALKFWYRFISPALYSLAKRIPILKSMATGHNPQRKFMAAPVAVLPFLSRCLLGTFSLPLIASTIGWALSYILKSQSSLRRTLLGGSIYLLLSYMAKISIEHHRGQLVGASPPTTDFNFPQQSPSDKNSNLRKSEEILNDGIQKKKGSSLKHTQLMSNQQEMSVTVVLDPVDRLITRVSPFGLGVLGASCAYYVAFSYGVGVFVLVLGKEQSTNLFGNAAENPLKIVIGLPMIPVALITLEALDVEGRLLYFWREKVSSKLSYVPVLGGYIDWIWPTPCREPLQSSQDGLGGSMDYLARSMSAGLLLPFAAYLVGLCFRSVIKSNTKRIFLGGLLYYSVKAIVKLYLRQEEYRRQGFRRVLNYNHIA